MTVLTMPIVKTWREASRVNVYQALLEMVKHADVSNMYFFLFGTDRYAVICGFSLFKVQGYKKVNVN